MARKFDFDLARSVLTLIPAGVFSSGIMLVDNFFASQISPEALRVHTIVAMIPFLFSTIGKTIGLPFIVAFTKVHSSQKKELVGSCLISGGAMSVFLLMAAFLGSGEFLKHFAIHNILFAKQYMVLQLCTSFFLLLMVLNTYFFLAMKRHREIFVTNLLAFILNLTGNVIATFSPLDQRVQYLAISSCVAALTSVILQLYWLRNALTVRLSELGLYMRRCQRMFFGQLGSMIILAGSPFIVSSLIQRSYPGLSLSLYNASNTVVQFLGLPVYACIVGSTSRVSHLLQNKDNEGLHTALQTISLIQIFLTFFPSVLIILSAKSFLSLYLNISPAKGVIGLFTVLCCRVFWLALTSQGLLILRIFEKQDLIARIDFATNLLTLAVFAALSQSQDLISVCIFALIIPQALYAIALNQLTKSVRKVSSQSQFAKSVRKASSQSQFAKPVRKASSQSQFAKPVRKASSQSQFSKKKPINTLIHQCLATSEQSSRKLNVSYFQKSIKQKCDSFPGGVVE